MPNAQDFPHLVTYPPYQLRLKLSASQWRDCVSDWCLLCRYYLKLPSSSFSEALSIGSTFIPFLLSYFEANPRDEAKDTENAQLREDIFRLVHRCLHSSKATPKGLLKWRFLGQLSKAYQGNASLRELLLHCWSLHRATVEQSLMEVEQALIGVSESKPKSGEISAIMDDLVPLVEELQPAGEYLFVGSDVLDLLTAIYVATPINEQKLIQSFVFACLAALLHSEKPNYSLIFDHIYSLDNLHSSAYQSSEGLKVDLVNNTNLLEELRKAQLSSEPRYKSVMKSLEACSRHFGRVETSNSSLIDSKGKERHKERFKNEITATRAVLISEVQDLFPELGSAFANMLLEEYADNSEEAIAHMLDNTLPAYLQGQDKSESLPDFGMRGKDLAPSSTPPPETLVHFNDHGKTTYSSRRNFYDDDAFDRLEINQSQLYFGRKEAKVSLNDHLQDDASSRKANKTAIYAALAAFDPDDDERDDTYDIADVGGSVDVSNDDATRLWQKTNTKADEFSDREADDMDQKLWNAWQTDNSVFGREAATRRSPARQQLKAESGLTDEAIEGWAAMIRRDPKRLQRLHDRFALGAGEGQAPLQRTARMSSRDNTASEDESGDGRGSEMTRGSSSGGLRGAHAGRGRGSGAATSTEKSSQGARQHKEANKGSRANHNRRNQRAKKMARGM